MALTAADRETYLEAGFDADEVDSWEYCECGSGEPTMMVLDHSPVCWDYHNEDDYLWNE